jgi:hypothetical protein
MQTKWHLGETKNYERFNFVESNREINDLNVDKIEKSILDIGIQVPIVVNKDYEIIEGQHRFVALRRNNLVVPYIVSSCADKGHIAKLQESKKWSAEDYCRSLATKGDIDCKIALEYAGKWFKQSKGKFSIIKSLEILMDGSAFSVLKSLKSQSFKVNVDIANNVYDAIDIMKDYENSASPYNNRISRSLKKISYQYGGLNLKAIKHMAKYNYITCYGSEGETRKYLEDKYKKSLRKCKN